MAVNSSNVFIGAPDQATTGAILSGTGTLPTSVSGTIPGTLIESGYIGEDGLKLTPSTSTTSIKDWSGKEIRRILTEFTGELEWAHLELNAQSLKNYFGDANVTTTAASPTQGTRYAVKLIGEELPIKEWVFKIKDGAKKILITVPFGQVVDRGEISFTSQDAITLPVTLATYPDSTGVSVYIYTDDGVTTA